MKKAVLLLLLPLLTACEVNPTTTSYSEPIPDPDPSDKFPRNKINIIKDDKVKLTLTPSLDSYPANSEVSFIVNLEDESKEITSVLIDQHECDWSDVYKFVMPFAPVTITIKTNEKKALDDTLPVSDYYTTITDYSLLGSKRYGRPKIESENSSDYFYLSDRDYPVYDKKDTSKPIHRFYPGDKLSLYKKDEKIAFALLTRFTPAEGKIERKEDDSGSHWYFKTENENIDTSKELTYFCSDEGVYDFLNDYSSFKEKLLKGTVYGYYSDIKTDKGYRLFGVGI